jgi:hypothetical protein
MPIAGDTLSAYKAEIAALRAVLANQTELLDECRSAFATIGLTSKGYPRGGDHDYDTAQQMLEKLSPPEGEANES